MGASFALLRWRLLRALLACAATLCACSGTTTPNNPCRLNNGGCDQHATCSNNDGFASCICESGYTGDGHVCISFSDCATGGVQCDQNATCVARASGPACVCNSGWSGDGLVCAPEDAGAGPDDSGQPFDAGPADAGGEQDAGDADAGPTITDAGPGEMDAGSQPDAGAPIDAGSGVDAGMPFDAGNPPDAGFDAGSPPDAGSYVDAGTISRQNDVVRGEIEMDPLELQWRGLLSTSTPPGDCANGEAADGTSYLPDAGAFPFVPPCLAGDTVEIIDQVRQADGYGPLGSGSTAWQGTYSAVHIDLVNTTLGLLGSVTDPSGLLAPSASVIALPTFASSGVAATPIPVVSTAFMQHIAQVIGISYASMMSQGVALIHIVEADGVTPAAEQELFWMHNIPEGTLTPGFYQNAYLTKLASNGPRDGPPYTFYLSADLNGVMAYSNDAVATSSSGLVVIVAPPALLFPNSDGSNDEMVYTVNESGEDAFIVFGVQPGAVVDVFLPDQ